jgi:hypothetical protein
MPSWNMLLDDNFLSSVELNYSITAKDFKVESISTNLSYFKQLFAVFTLTYVHFFGKWTFLRILVEKMVNTVVEYDSLKG